MHHGISQANWIYPHHNAEHAVFALVEYAPGRHTQSHLHDGMERAFFVLQGRALFQLGEIERRVGPGNLVFASRFVKHSYKVIGDVPFKFLQMEFHTR